MKLNNKDLLLYAVTDRSWLGGQTLAEQIEKALNGGVTCVQLREKDLPEEAFEAEAVEIKKLARNYGVPFMINDNVALAMKCEADGVHVGQSDMKTADVRAWIGENAILGVSVHTTEQAIAAEKGGADYLGVGAVFPTSTKDDTNAVTYETLKEICEAVSIPVVAIGGITKENMTSLSDSGISGVALVSAIFAQPDITASCRELRLLAEAIAI